MIENKDIKYIFGVQICHDRLNKTLTLFEDKYIRDILDKFHMLNCNPLYIPFEACIKFSKAHYDNLSPDDQLLMSQVPYNEAIGSFQYLVTWTGWVHIMTILVLMINMLITQVPYKEAIGSFYYLVIWTRCDLAFVVDTLAQFMANAAPIHWLGVKHIFRYLRGTMTCSLTFIGANFLPSSHHVLQGWNDAHWAGDINTYSSISGYIFQLDSSCLLFWQSRKQSTVVLSTSEVEYIAALAATKELLWLHALIYELGYSLQLPSTLYYDNQFCIALSENPKFHDRSKHIDLRYHFLRDHVHSKILQLEYTPTSHM